MRVKVFDLHPALRLHIARSPSQDTSAGGPGTTGTLVSHVPFIAALRHVLERLRLLELQPAQTPNFTLTALKKGRTPRPYSWGAEGLL